MEFYQAYQQGQEQQRQKQFEESQMQQQERAMQQEQTISGLAQQYMRDPNPQTISQIAAFSPEKAQGLMKAQQQVMQNKARSIKSFANTFNNMSESQIADAYPELIKKYQKQGVDTRSMPLEYNKDTSQQIKDIIRSESQKADRFLNPERATAKDVSGRLRYRDTQEPVFEKVQEEYKPQSPEGKKEADIRAGYLTRGQAIDRGEPGKGYRWTPEGNLEAIPGGPAETISGEVAGKIALYKGGLADTKSFRNYLFTKEGKLNRPFIAKMNAPFGAGRFGDVRDAHSKISNAIEAKLRAETGAAATTDEINRNVEKFMPSIRDNERTVKNKMDRLEKFLSDTIELSTRGRRQETQDLSTMSAEELLGGF